MKRFLFFTMGAAVVSVAATACGSGTGANNASVASGGTSAATVASRTVGGVGAVLVDAQGRTLYTPQQEASGHITCTGACTQVWVPVVPAGGSSPVAGPGVSGALGTVMRPDGISQVTIAGKPLYRFALDKSAGQATGNAATDMFGSNAFTWHVLTADGSTAAGSPAPAGSSSGNGGYGGYGGG